MQVKEWGSAVRTNIAKVFVGKDDRLELILTALLAGGHVLLDDVPGVGKTRLARALAISCGVNLARIQCTPDLLPSDIVGVSIYQPQEGNFRFRKGPVINPFVLVDEINRASPRTQSALLEAMGEGQVSVEGKAIALPKPFFVIATQNPVDSEGTYPLPEAQKDRFMLTLSLGYLSASEELELFKMKDRAQDVLGELKGVCTWEDLVHLQATISSVHVADSLREYILALCQATRESALLRMGVSPRGSLAMFRCSQALAALRGRDFVKPEDIQDLLVPTLVSRIIPRQQSIVKGMDARTILGTILESVPVPMVANLS